MIRLVKSMEIPPYADTIIGSVMFKEAKLPDSWVSSSSSSSGETARKFCPFLFAPPWTVDRGGCSVLIKAVKEILQNFTIQFCKTLC